MIGRGYLDDLLTADAGISFDADGYEACILFLMRLFPYLSRTNVIVLEASVTEAQPRWIAAPGTEGLQAVIHVIRLGRLDRRFTVRRVHAASVYTSRGRLLPSPAAFARAAFVRGLRFNPMAHVQEGFALFPVLDPTTGGMRQPLTVVHTMGAVLNRSASEIDFNAAEARDVVDASIVKVVSNRVACDEYRALFGNNVPTFPGCSRCGGALGNVHCAGCRVPYYAGSSGFTSRNPLPRKVIDALLAANHTFAPTPPPADQRVL